jgi:hypothetical protein
MADLTSLLIQKIALEGEKEIQAKLDAIGKAGKDAFDKLGDTKGSGKSLDELTRGLTGVEAAAVKFGFAIRELGDNVGASIAQIGVAAAKLTGVAAAIGTAVFGLAKSAANAADEVRDGAIRTGQSATSWQKLGFAFEQSGGKAGGLERVMHALNNAVGSIKENKPNEIAKGFQALGVSLVDSAGDARPALDVLSDLSARLLKIENPAERAGKIITIFGRRVGPQLNELLGEGSKGIQALAKDAERLGIVMDDAQLKVGDDMNDALNRLARSSKATSTQLGLLFAPIFTEAANRLAESAADTREQFLKLGRIIADFLAPIIRDFVSLAVGEPEKIQSGFIKALDSLLRGLIVVGKAAIEVMRGLLIIADLVASAINAVFGTKLSGGDIVMFLIIVKLIAGFTVLASLLKVVTSGLGLMVAAFNALGGAAGILARIALSVGGVAGALGAIPLILIALAAAAVAFFAVWAFQNWDAIRLFAVDTWNAILAGATALWLQIVALWQGGLAFLAGIWAGITSAAQVVWDAITVGVTALWLAITTAWQAGLDFIIAIWNAIVAATQAVWDAIIAGARALWTGIVGIWNSGINAIIGFLTKLKDFAVGVWNAITDAAKKAFGAQKEASAAGGSGFARGGRVWGPGTGTSDSIPAYLSAGEFVMRAAAVRKYGTALLYALNSMRLDPSAFQGFAAGGLIEPLKLLMPSPLRMADGGAVPATASQLRPINLTIGGETFGGLLAPDSVAQKLMQVAVSRQMRSNGRKPAYYGAGR